MGAMLASEYALPGLPTGRKNDGDGPLAPTSGKAGKGSPRHIAVAR